MKFDKNSITKDNPSWELGDVICGNGNLCLVARIDYLDNEVSARHFYTLVNLDSGYSSEGYETIAELQHHTGDANDRILTGSIW